MIGSLNNAVGAAVVLAAVAELISATAVARTVEFTLPAPNGVEVCAYPSVACMEDGRLLCVYSGVEKRSGGPKMTLFATYSADDGQSWAPPKPLLDTPGQNNYDSSIIVIGSRVIVSSTTAPVSETSIDRSQTWAVRSEDEGRTWSPPYEIAMGRRYTSGKTNNGIVLSDGTALLGYTWENNLEGGAEPLDGEGDMDEVSAALLSFDDGLTWTSSEGVGLDRRKLPAARDAINGLCEPALVECGDGSVFMLCRTGLQTLYETRSIDGGRHWQEPKPSPLTSHNAPAALCRFGGSREGVLAVWNNSPQDRWPLCVAASTDDCRTWTTPRELARREGFEASYPCCTQTSDGHLLVVYQQQGEAGRQIRGVKFPVEWLFNAEADSEIAPALNSHDVAADSAPVVLEPNPAEPVELAHFPFMPKPVITPDGAWLAYVVRHEGPGLDATPAQQSVEVITSNDRGQTWSEPEAVVSLPAKEGGFGYFVPLADRSGEVHLFLLCDANTGAIRPRTKDSGLAPFEPLARQRLDIWHVRSHDSRSQWSEPRRIWQGRAGDLQSVTQLRSGRIVLPFSYLVDRNWSQRGAGPDEFTYMGQFDNTVIYSDDGGDTWQTSASILRTATPDLASYGAIEPVVLQLADDRVWMLVRTQMGRFYESYSADGAEWSPFRPSTIKSSDSPAGLARLADGRMLMVWNNCQRHPYAQGSRHVLHAAVSDDDGKSWSGYREIVRDSHRNEPPPPSGDHGASYPYLAAGPDGSVAMSAWVETGGGRTLWRLDPHWLDASSARDDFSDGLDQWSVFGVRGATVVAHPDRSGAHALQLKLAESPWKTAAVWNFPAGSSGAAHVRLKIEPSAPLVSLQIADHFSPPFDDQAELNSLAHTLIATKESTHSAIALTPGQWSTVTITWDVPKGTYALSVDGRQCASGLLDRRDGAPCYLRLALDDSDAARTGTVMIDEVSSELLGK